MVELNQRYRVKTVFAVVKEGMSRAMVGTVVYIHPMGRFAVLEFAGPIGKARESFYLEQLTEKNQMLQKRRGA